MRLIEKKGSSFRYLIAGKRGVIRSYRPPRFVFVCEREGPRAEWPARIHRWDCWMVAFARKHFPSRFLIAGLVTISEGRLPYLPRYHEVCPECNPTEQDSYHQCRRCGELVTAQPRQYNETCRCSNVTVDPMSPIGPDSPVTVNVRDTRLIRFIGPADGSSVKKQQRGR
jgi:hypothetical protein